MAKILKGKVQEVRTFGSTVYLFVTGTEPETLKNKLIRFELTDKNCDNIHSAAGLAIGAEVTIERMEIEYRYSFKIKADNNGINANNSYFM